MPAPHPREWLSVLRKHAAWTTLAAFLVGLAALPAIGFGRAWLGLALILMSRALAFAASDDGARGTALDLVFFASLPFAFALADPSRALAATFLLFGFVAASAMGERGTHRIDAIVCTLAFAVACAFPGRFSLVAYGLGLACFAVAGVRIARLKDGV